MDQHRTRLVQLLQNFDTGVLVTQNAAGHLHGRPMEVAKVEPNGSVYFCTSLDSPKVHEIKQDPAVAVFFQKSHHWVSLYGNAEIVHDRQMIEELWREKWKVWYPEGKNSPEICLLHVAPISGEYWDSSGLQGVQFALSAARAYVTGKPMSSRGEGNAKVSM